MTGVQTCALPIFPSGPHFEPTDLNTAGVHGPRQLAWRVLFRHGLAQAGPHRYDSRALDYLIGYWHAPRDWRRAWLRRRLGRRVGGVGFYHAAELAGDFTPTQTAKPNGRQPIALDAILLNQSMAAAYVPGSYRVHPFPDPDNPDSDHHRVSVTVDV